MSAIQSTQAEQRPWYKEPWLWLVILLPVSAVIAGTATLIIAYLGADDLVIDDYYKVGIAINQNIEAQAKAEQLEIKAKLFLSGEKVQLQLHHNENQNFVFPSRLTLDFFHPTLQKKDSRIELSSISRGLYSANFTNTEISGKRYLRITPDNQQWILKQEIIVEIGQPIFLDANK